MPTEEGTRGRPLILAALTLFCLLLIATPVVAQTRPAGLPVAPTGLESQSVQRSRATTGTAGDGIVNWHQLIVATVVVIGLIVALRYVAGWLIPGARAGGGGRGVRVLSRTNIAPRQQVVLLHVGRRVIVVGDSAGTLSSLASIDDPDEVAEMLGQAAAAPAAGTRFRSMFGRAETQYDDNPETMTAADDPDAAEPIDPAVAAAKDDLNGLLDRMRSLTKTVGK